MRMHDGTPLARGSVLVLSVAALSVLGARARRPEGGAVVRDVPALGQERHALEQSLAAARGELTLARLQLDRAQAIIEYSTRYGIPADLAAAIYDAALAEGVEPGLAFCLVEVESHFTPTAKSRAGAIGYTQILPSTARLYEPGLSIRQLYDRRTNLHLGFRYLRDLLERYQGAPAEQLRLALLAYNRGPGRVQALLDAGLDPKNGYASDVMKGFRRKS
jgi:soluble lytic murein transglycosylase-like protein